MKLTAITHRVSPIGVYTNNESINKSPLALLFIQSVIKADILTEAKQLGQLESLLSAGYAKLQAAMSPGITDDLINMMFLRKGGNIPHEQIKNQLSTLLENAKTIPNNIINNDAWWNTLFTTLHIIDQTQQAAIKQKVTAEAGGAPAGDSTGAASQAKQAAEDENKQLSDIIARAKEGREAAMKRIIEIQNKIKALQNPTATTEPFVESILCGIGLSLLAEKNINCAQPELHKYLSYKTTLTEAQFINKLGRALKTGLNTARNHLANPNTTKIGADNVRLAKLAIQTAAELFKQEINTKLQQHGVDLQKAVAIVKKAAEVLATYKSTGVMPQGEEAKIVQLAFAIVKGVTVK